MQSATHRANHPNQPELEGHQLLLFLVVVQRPVVQAALVHPAGGQQTEDIESCAAMAPRQAAGLHHVKANHKLMLKPLPAQPFLT